MQWGPEKAPLKQGAQLDDIISWALCVKHAHAVEGRCSEPCCGLLGPDASNLNMQQKGGVVSHDAG